MSISPGCQTGLGRHAAVRSRYATASFNIASDPAPVEFLEGAMARGIRDLGARGRQRSIARSFWRRDFESKNWDDARRRHGRPYFSALLRALIEGYGKMDWRSVLTGFGLAALGGWANPVLAGDPWLRDGAYEMVTRLELPHLERYAIDSVHRVCFVGGRATDGSIPTPVESANHPFTSCAADHIERGVGAIEYDIACPGRDLPQERTRAIAPPTTALSAASRWSWAARI